jgi:hypothetical protein
MGHFNPEVFSDGKEGIVFSYSPIIVFDGLLIPREHLVQE